MRILHITPAYWPAIHWGGPIISVHLLAKTQRALGNDVSVFTTTLGLKNNKNNTTTLDGVVIFYFASFRISTWHVPLFSFIRTLWRASDAYDIFHIHLTWDPICWMSAFILVLKKKKIIWSPRGAIEEYLIESKNRFLKKIIYYFLLKPLYKKITAFHFTSEYEKQKFFEYTRIARLCAVIFNPININEYAPLVDISLLEQWNLRNKKYFLYIGRINWKKGLEILVNAFALFLEKNNDWHLVIAGPDENNLREKLKQIAQQRKIDATIIFIDLVEGDEKLALLQSCRAFILPSHSENFGIAAIEALCAGVPLIISKNVGVAELVKKYKAGYIAEPTVQNIFQKMKYLIEHPDKIAVLKENGLRLVHENLTPHTIVEKMLQLYSCILR